MAPSAPTGWLIAQTDREGERKRGRRGQGRDRPGDRERQTDRKTERLIRVCFFSVVGQGLRR